MPILDFRFNQQLDQFSRYLALILFFENTIVKKLTHINPLDSIHSELNLTLLQLIL